MDVRVMTYNIYEGAVGREDAVLDVVRAAEADVIVFQEVLDRASADRLGDALGMRVAFAASNARTRNIALLSRYPLVAGDVFHPFPLLRTLLLATILLPGGERLNLFGLHLGLIHDLWRAYELRTVFKRISSYARNHPTSLALLLGDFNAVAPGDNVALSEVPFYYKAALALQFVCAPRTVIRSVRRAGYIDCYRACHPHGDGFTVPTCAPSARLDYLFASRPLATCLYACDVVRWPTPVNNASDHYPLVADFEF